VKIIWFLDHFLLESFTINSGLARRDPRLFVPGENTKSEVTTTPTPEVPRTRMGAKDQEKPLAWAE
jgi:hypothetical protein